MSISKIDLERNKFCKIDFEVQSFIFGCFYPKSKFDIKFKVKFST